MSNKEYIVKGQSLNMNNINMINYNNNKNNNNININNQDNPTIILQDSTLESHQFMKQIKNTPLIENSLQSDIFNTSNNIKAQGVLHLKFSNTETQLIQAQGEKEVTIGDNFTLESEETLNSYRSHQNMKDNQENIYQNHQMQLQLDNQTDKKQFSGYQNNHNQYQTTQQKMKEKNINNNNIPALKIESSEERIISACQLNFDDYVDYSQSNLEQNSSQEFSNNPSVNTTQVAYSYRQKNQLKEFNVNNQKNNENKNQYNIMNNQFNNNQNQFNNLNQFQSNNNQMNNINKYGNTGMQDLQQQNFQKKKQMNEQDSKDEAKLQEAINYQKEQFQLQKKQYEEKMQQQANQQKRNIQPTQNYPSQKGYSNFEEEKEGERQKPKFMKDVFIKEKQGVYENKKESLNSMNLDNNEDKKSFPNILTTNSDVPSTIQHKSFRSETSNIFEQNKIYQTYNNIQQYNDTSSQRIVTLNPNQDAFDDYLQNKDTYVENYGGKQWLEEVNERGQNKNNTQQFQFLNIPQFSSSNLTYNTPTLKGGKITENTFESIEFQQQQQQHQQQQPYQQNQQYQYRQNEKMTGNYVCEFNISNNINNNINDNDNNNRFVEQVIEKYSNIDNLKNQSNLKYNKDMYNVREQQESEYSVCNEMQEVLINKNDKPQLKSYNQQNKVSNPALLSSHATEDNNSFLHSKRNHETPNKSFQSNLESERFCYGNKSNNKKINIEQNEKYNIQGEEDFNKNRRDLSEKKRKDQTENISSNTNLKHQILLNSRPHFLSQEIQIPLVSNLNENNSIYQSSNQMNSQIIPNNSINQQNDQQFEDEFSQKLNSIVCDNPLTNQNDQFLLQIQEQSSSSHPWMKDDQYHQFNQFNEIKRDSQPIIVQPQQLASSNMILGQLNQYNNVNHIESNNQIFSSYQQQRIQKCNDEIRQKIKQINYSYTPSNSIIQVSQVNISSLEPEEKSFKCATNNILVQSDNHTRYEVLENKFQIHQLQNQENSQPLLQQQYQSYSSSSLSSQKISLLENNQSKGSINQKNISLNNSTLNRKNSTSRSSRYDNKSQYNTVETTARNLSENKFTQQQQQQQTDTTSVSGGQGKNGKPTPQLDQNILTDDMQINPFDVISPQEKLANYISFHSGQQELNPHQYPSFQYPPQSSNGQINLFMNQETETDLQYLKKQEIDQQQSSDNITYELFSQNTQNLDNQNLNNFNQNNSNQMNSNNQKEVRVNQNSFNQQRSNSNTRNQSIVNQKIQNEYSLNQKNEKLKRNNLTILNENNNLSNITEGLRQNNERVKIEKQQDETQRRKYELNKIMNCNLDSVISPSSTSSKPSNSSHHSTTNHLQPNLFSYKQFMMNMKKNLDQNLIKQCPKKQQKNNESFSKKSSAVKKPLNIGTVNIEKQNGNKDIEKLNKLIDEQLQKNVIRPILSRNKGDKENNQDQDNLRRKTSHSHYTPSSQLSSNNINPNSIPTSKNPIDLQIESKPLQIDVNYRNYQIEPRTLNSSNTVSSGQNKNKPTLCSKSALNTPKSNNRQLQSGKSCIQNGNSRERRRNTNNILLDDFSQVSSLTPSSSKTNLNRNHSYHLNNSNNLNQINNSKYKITNNVVLKENIFVNDKSPSVSKSRQNSQGRIQNKNLLIKTTIEQNNNHLQKGYYDELLSSNLITHTHSSKRNDSSRLLQYNNKK